MKIPTGGAINAEHVKSQLIPESIQQEAREVVSKFISELFAVFVDCNFTYLEINPLVYSAGRIHVLDLAAKLDQTAEFESGKKWNSALKRDEFDSVEISFPAPFGRDLTR